MWSRDGPFFRYFSYPSSNFIYCSLNTDNSHMKNEWIYYLRLSQNLDQNFINLDQGFKEFGHSLVPVTITDLLNMAKSGNSMQVITVVDKISRYQYYNLKVRKILKYLLKRENISFYVLSSFENSNDKKSLGSKNNYFFTSIPVSIKDYTFTVSEVIKIKEAQYNSWPGARRRVYPRGEKF